MNYNELKQIAETKNIEVREIANQLEMTSNGFRESVKNETIQLKRLRQLCEILDINPISFFEGITKEGNKNFNKNLIEIKDKEIDMLKQRLEDKNDLILMLREKIDHLQNVPLMVAKPITGYSKIKK